ncbi:hypothetical protein EDC04DRAFT_2602047 [Pisolithus marmoratus]|nr:hypothetical protein EDC04DRAFT_2602047 [Pisolithus marmoratus]
MLVLMHCSFEETAEIVVEAAAIGEQDDCHSIAGDLTPMGTGAFDVALDIDMLKDAIVDNWLLVQNILAAHVDGGMTPGKVSRLPDVACSRSFISQLFTYVAFVLTNVTFLQHGNHQLVHPSALHPVDSPGMIFRYVWNLLLIIPFIVLPKPQLVTAGTSIIQYTAMGDILILQQKQSTHRDGKTENIDYQAHWCTQISRQVLKEGEGAFCEGTSQFAYCAPNQRSRETDSPSGSKDEGDILQAWEELEVYSDPGFKSAFERVLNQCLDKVLALYLSWRGFQENCSQSMIDRIRAAFKMLWDERQHNIPWGLALQRCMALMGREPASIRHKVSSEGAEWTHSGTMKKEYMDKILTWSESQCLLDFPSEYIHLAMMGFQALPLGESLSKNAKLVVTRHLQHLACGATMFTLWTRNYKLMKLKHGDINLDKTIIDSMFMKYLQCEEWSLTINKLSSYFEIHLKNRKGWQRKLDKGMRESDLQSNHYRIYPCPDMGRACDVFLHLLFWMKWVEYVHLGWPMAEDDFLFPAISANGVLQLGEPLSHNMVQKWIDEAVTGEAALVQPASTEALNMVHASLTVEVAVLHTKVEEASSFQGSDLDLCMLGVRPPLTLQCSLLSTSTSAFMSLPSQVGPHRTVRTCPSDLPQGLFIPNVPVLHENGMWMLKADSWRDIDWPQHYYNGPHGRKFNTKYYQQSMVTTEFLNEFRGDEEAFLKAYGHTTSEGHTRLLKAILDAHKQHRGDGECRHHFANEVCDCHLLDTAEQQS